MFIHLPMAEEAWPQTSQDMPSVLQILAIEWNIVAQEKFAIAFSVKAYLFLSFSFCKERQAQSPDKNVIFAF